MGRMDNPNYAFSSIARRMYPFALMKPEELPTRPIIEEAIFPPEGYVANSNLRDDTHFREFFRSLFKNTYTHPALWGGIDVVGFRRESRKGIHELTYYFYEVKGITVPNRPRRERNTQFPISAHQVVGPYGMRENLHRIRRSQQVDKNGAVLRHAYGGFVWMLCHHPERDRDQREYDIYVTAPMVAVGRKGSNIKYEDKRSAPRASVRDKKLEALADKGVLLDVTDEFLEPRLRRFAVSPQVRLPAISTPAYRAMISQQEDNYYARLSAEMEENWRNEGWSGDELPFTSASIDDIIDPEVPF